jgi:hypothetical protein
VALRTWLGRSRMREEPVTEVLGPVGTAAA